MKKKIKKAFTLVELLVVIAILAILATVSIVGYNSFTKKARVSNDTVLVKQMNDILFANSQTDDANPTMSKALEDVFDGGYDLTKLTPTTTNYNIMWDRAKDQMVLADENLGIVYPEASKVSENHEDLFVVVKNAEELSKRTNAGYSVYLHDDFTGTEITDLKAGIDTGKVTAIKKINYSNSNKKDVVMNTDGQMCELTIDGPNDHVEHYGYAKTINVNSVDKENSYHEFGTTTELNITSGKIVIEQTAIVFNLNATNSTNSSISNNGGNILKSNVPAITPSENFQINSLQQFEAFRDATNSGVNFSQYNSNNKKIVLNTDIHLNSAWKPISNYYRGTAEHLDKWFAGYFDGNGHTIYGLTNKGLASEKINTGYDSTTPQGNTECVYGLFASINCATIKNINFKDVDIDANTDSSLKGDHVGALVGYAKGDVTISNVNVYGSIKGFDGTAGIIGGIRETTSSGAKVENCNNYATINSYRRCAGIIGNINTIGKVEIINCSNYADVRITNEVVEIQNAASGIANTAIPNQDEYDTIVSYVNCKNNGNITGAKYIGKVCVIYTTEYNNNSTGNILNNNTNTNLDNHVYTSENNGTLTAVSNNHKWNWNE